MEKVAIVIENWNGEGYLKECLGSLMNVNYENFYIILVDSGSFDNSVLMIEQKFPRVIIIKNEENLGFSSAVNQGIKRAINDGSEFILLLNNNTVVDPDFLTRMVKVLKKEEKVGIVGCKIYYFTEPNKIWFAGGDFIEWRMAGKYRYRLEKEENRLSGVHDSDFITSCCLLIRSKVLERVGYLHEPYFLGFEDLDFCYQAAKYGWDIKVNLDAKIYHKVSLVGEGETFSLNGYYRTRNRLYFAFVRAKKYFAGFVLLLIIFPARILQGSLEGNWQISKGILLGIRDFLRSRMGKYQI
jgi:GT2 family glycosyltransferase